jgi:hypothetical protein
VLGGAARVEAERGLEVPDGPLALEQRLEDPDPHRVAEDTKQLRLEDVHGVGAHVGRVPGSGGLVRPAGWRRVAIGVEA